MSGLKQLKTGADKLASVWNDSRRAAIRASFSSVREPWVSATLDAVERALDGYGQKWVAMHYDTAKV